MSQGTDSRSNYNITEVSGIHYVSRITLQGMTSSFIHEEGKSQAVTGASKRGGGCESREPLRFSKSFLDSGSQTAGFGDDSLVRA